jgi:RNase P subunit RPR2
MKKEREFENMSEKKLFCHKCGNEINKYAYAEVSITSIIVIENERHIHQTEIITYCLKCFFPKRFDILELIRND